MVQVSLSPLGAHQGKLGVIWDSVHSVQTLLATRREVEGPGKGQNMDLMVLKRATSNLIVLGEVSHAPSDNECEVFITCSRSDYLPCSSYWDGAHGPCYRISRGSGCTGVGCVVLGWNCGLSLPTYWLVQDGCMAVFFHPGLNRPSQLYNEDLNTFPGDAACTPRLLSQAILHRVTEAGIFLGGKQI